MKNLTIAVIIIFLTALLSCRRHKSLPDLPAIDIPVVVDTFPPDLLPDEITLRKNLKYDTYTLKDTYPYYNTVRTFKWEQIKHHLAEIENMQSSKMRWAVMNNYKNCNGIAPRVKKYRLNASEKVTDTLGVDRYQGIPVYERGDTSAPTVYARDGSFMWLNGSLGTYWRVQRVGTSEELLVPQKYVKVIENPVFFSHVIVVDRGDQNIATLERTARGKWDILSMNPATTGRYLPPYAQKTPLGKFILQDKKKKMPFLKDGSTALAGTAPFACRFSSGAHIHGVPTNLPDTGVIEFSWSLGTVPKSHMCVRNASSHAQFIYDWAPTARTIVLVIE